MPNCMFGQITKEFKEFFYVNCKVEDLYNLELVPKLKLALLMQGKYAYFLRYGHLLLEFLIFYSQNFVVGFIRNAFFSLKIP